MGQRAAVRLSLLLNISVLLIVIILTVYFRDAESRYFRFGPSTDLHVVSVVVDTWGKYVGVLGILTIIGISDVIISEIAVPILGFTVYNPDKLTINEFSKCELQVLANAMFMTSNIRSVFMLIVSVTQVDLALFSVLVTESTSIFTIRWLLNKKQFRQDALIDDDLMELI